MHTISAPPSPGLRAWSIWIVSAFAYVLAIVNRSSLSAVGVDAAERFQADASILALFAVVQLAVYGGGQIPVGFLLDRFGARPVMTVGMLIMAVGQLTLALSESVAVALVARILLGAGDAAVFPGVLRLIALWFPAQRNSLMVQMTGFLGQAGQIVAVLPLATLLHSTSWSITFGSIAGLVLLFGILVWLIVRNRPPELKRDVTVNTETGVIRTVTSAMDTRLGIRAALAHPGTRLAFWCHFTPPFAGTAFVLLWGMPYLTLGEGLDMHAASGLLTLFVVAGMGFGPVLGELSRRFPYHRSLGLVIPIIALQSLVWGVVLLWPGPAPFWLLVVLMIALGFGGPTSMVAFDHVRAYNPIERLSTATGAVNAGGFIAALIAVFFIGVTMDLQGAGTPATYSLDAFRVAFATQYPLWLIGAIFVIIERKRTRLAVGIDKPRS